MLLQQQPARVVSENLNNSTANVNGEIAQDAVLSFGKHKGKKVKQIDGGYVRWMQQTFQPWWWKNMARQAIHQHQTISQHKKKKILLSELKVCCSTRNLRRGKEIHVEATQNGHDTCIYFATSLVKMYSNCGCMAEARQAFNRIEKPDVVSWTALILGYADSGEGVIALDLFKMMKAEGCSPDFFTFVAALKACTSLMLGQKGFGRAECLEWGKGIHSQIGCHSDVHLQSTLINMYAKCGSMVDARQVFDSIKRPDVVAWNALILGYAENGEGVAALNLFARMRYQGCAPDSVTFVSALKACTSFTLDQTASGKKECLERGKEIHSQIGACLNMYVESTLINMYSNCGSMVDARQVFQGMKDPDVVSWNALILGYAENGEGVVALNLFARMRSQGCEPNFRTFVAALKACGLLGALECGITIHAEIKTGNEPDGILVTCLVDFYAKCGDLLKAQNVFDLHPSTRDLTTWNALLGGFSRLGEHDTVFGLVKEIQDAGFQPDRVTFLCVLMCCSHAGLVHMGMGFLKAMSTNYGVTPTVEHYNCLIDNLGRSNKLAYAVAFLHSMPCRPDAVSWNTVLAACRKWKNVEIGRLAFKALVGLDDTNAAAYVSMAHIYGSRGMWNEQEMVLAMRKELKDWKEPGQTCWTNEKGQVHTFLAGDSKQTRQKNSIHEVPSTLINMGR